MNKLKIIIEEGLTKVYVDDVEIKNINSIRFKQNKDGYPLATIEFYPEAVIETEAIVTKKAKPVYDKCGACKWLDQSVKCSIGCLCRHPERKFNTTASYKQLHQKACKKFEERKRND